MVTDSSRAEACTIRSAGSSAGDHATRRRDKDECEIDCEVFGGERRPARGEIRRRTRSPSVLHGSMVVAVSDTQKMQAAELIEFYASAVKDVLTIAPNDIEDNGAMRVSFVPMCCLMHSTNGSDRISSVVARTDTRPLTESACDPASAYV